MSHDRNFKNLILDYPRQALSFFAPAEAAEIGEQACITPVRQEQLQGRLVERFREPARLSHRGLPSRCNSPPRTPP